MCEGFGVIVDKELNLFFSEPNTEGHCSHSTTIERLGWEENSDQHLRHFVRVQFADWQPASFEFDEEKTLPGWCENAKVKIREKCEILLGRCAPAWAEHQRVRDAAWAEYQRVRDAALAEYERVRAPAWAEYERVRDAAWVEYQRVRDAAWVEYQRVRAPAWAEYERVRAPAWAVMIATLAAVPGYVAEQT